jgi:hypothetical protein
MKTLPITDHVPVVNSVLAPYFKDLARELRFMTEKRRTAHLNKYKDYIEREAQKTTNNALRLQLRLNMMALIQQYGDLSPEFEITVFPKHHNIRVFDGNGCRDAYAEELIPMRI